MSDDRLHRMESKIDQVVEKIGNIDMTLAAQHISLKEHMRRSNALERQMEPIKTHVAMVQGAIKFLSLIAIMATIVTAFIMIWGKK
jgi:hypothetical protein